MILSSHEHTVFYGSGQFDLCVCPIGEDHIVAETRPGCPSCGLELSPAGTAPGDGNTPLAGENAELCRGCGARIEWDDLDPEDESWFS